ncbi:hypothetical protein C455_04481 [Haloferax larsenii JCM 13917]|nr:DUF5367 family protein [Haloferax larsenii]ELZ81419.1 hypothetical protein C455_04481 [Haloferax larsenii JCM 13917]
MATESRTVPTRGLTFDESRLLLGLGLSIALVAGVVFRVVGHFVLDPSNPAVVAAVFVVTVPAMWVLAAGIFRWRGHTGGARREAAAVLVVPGMLVDAASTALFQVVYPNMVVSAAGLFGGLLLLAYATILVAGFVELPIGNRETEEAAEP